MIINLNFFIETILFLSAILASNGFIYSLTIFNLNSSENISVIRNSSEKNVLALTFLIGSNPLRLISSESSTSQALSMTSSDTNVSQTLSVTSSDTNVSQDIFDDKDLIDLERNEEIMTQTQDTFASGTTEIIPIGDTLEHFTSQDSLTVLNRQSLDEWFDIAMDMHELSHGTPFNILRQIKFEELNILYSQDLIYHGITQTELRLIIEMVPAWNLFLPDVNHFILMIINYYH